MFTPSLEEVKKLSGKYNMIPVMMEVYADMVTPITIFKQLEREHFCFLLESVEGGEKWARYSFIGRNPFLTIKSYGNKIIIDKRDRGIEETEGNPIEVIKSIIGQYNGAVIPNMPRFNGGAVGFFGYDLIRHYEKLPNMVDDDMKLPECHFMFTDEVVAFDHMKQKIFIIVNMHVDGEVEALYSQTVERIKRIYEEIASKVVSGNSINQKTYENTNKEINTKSNITKEKFCENVKTAKEYIKDGDIFQVVLSQRLMVETQIEPFNVYRSLRLLNPSPYMYYLKFDEYTIAGASPEMLVRVENKTVETCPIAGTRKRGADEQEDLMLEKELLSDQKELSEHTMLIDLGRNDIGRVAKFGTVRTENLMHIERYSHVMHIVSNVIGKMRDDKTPFDALMSVLPAGTLSGAPKVRAMEVIEELETTKRGTYGGAIGYLSFNGNLDSCITIRTVVFQNGKAYIQAGGGIVADSVPENEYEESLNKAMALLKAIKEAGDII